MASYQAFNPLSTEAKSSLIAGLTEAISKISISLNLQTSTFEDVEMVNVFISDTDLNRIYEVALDKKGWLSDPMPIVKKNGVVISPVADYFSIDYLGGSIEFIGAVESRPTSSDTITVSATYINQYSTVLNNLATQLTETTEKVDKYKGSYSSVDELETIVTNPSTGDYAIILGTEYTVYIWNATEGDWQKCYTDVSLANYYTSSQTDNLLNSKEPTVTAQGSTATSDNYYYGGRKTWIDLLAKVRGTVLTGLSTATQTAITATDTVLTALGKLQAQITQNKTDIALRATTDSVTQGLATKMTTSTYDTNGNGIVDKSENGIFVVAHSKSGTVHTLTGALPSNTSPVSIQFYATADFNVGDSIVLNGTAMGLNNVEYFKNDSYVLLEVNPNRTTLFGNIGVTKDYMEKSVYDTNGNGIVNKSENGIFKLICTKVGTVFNLTGYLPTSGSSTVVFQTMEDFVTGDTIQLNGVTMTTTNISYFKKYDIVTLFKEGNYLVGNIGVTKNYMEKSGGTFTGNVLAIITNREGTCLRNSSVKNNSNELVSTNSIQFSRK